MGKPRRKIDAMLKAKIALDAWKKQLLDNAARAFDPGVGVDAEHMREREVEHPKVGVATTPRSRSTPSTS